jgi:O-antigen ligase
LLVFDTLGADLIKLWRNDMDRNLASWDRIARFVLGALLVILALTGTIGIWGWVGVVLLATAGMNFCPAYKVFGFKTCTDC